MPQGAAAINERFRASPYDPAQWHANGELAVAGVLIHLFDRWEEHDHCYSGEDRPCYHHYKADVQGRPHLSCSLIYAQQRSDHHPQIAIPTYGGEAGVILRPGPTSRIECGSEHDTGLAPRAACPQHIKETAHTPDSHMARMLHRARARV